MTERYDFNEPAPEGQVYICGACGKSSPTRSGYDHDGKRVARGRWDEACFMNAVLCYEERSANGEYRAVES